MTTSKEICIGYVPYPSGDLHMGHAEAYALGDVIARYWIQKVLMSCTQLVGCIWITSRKCCDQTKCRSKSWTYENMMFKKLQCADMPAHLIGIEPSHCDPDITNGINGYFLRCLKKDWHIEKLSG